MYKDLYVEDKQKSNRSDRRFLLDIYKELADIKLRLLQVESDIQFILAELETEEEPPVVEPPESIVEEQALLNQVITEEEDVYEKWNASFKKKLKKDKDYLNDKAQLEADARMMKKLDYVDYD